MGSLTSACDALATHSRFPKRARTPLVEDGEDFQNVSVVDEIDGEREAPSKNAANLEEYGCVSEWVVRRPFYRSIELEEELETQARLFRLVPCGCVTGLSLRARLDVDGRQARRSFVNS